MPPLKDLTNKKNNRLTVLKKSDKRTTDGSVFWECICDCGNKILVPSKSLTSGNTKSCGCLNLDRVNQPHPHIVEGTSISSIKNKSIFCTNTTGVRGVSFNKRSGLYRAYIGFKGKTYYLGYFKSVDEAKKARLLAEDKLYNNFLDWYKEENEQ